MSDQIKWQYVTWPVKMDQVGTQKLTIFSTSLNCTYLQLPLHYHYEIFRGNVEFNKEAFAAYRNQILHTEAEIYTVLWLGVVCAHLVHFCWPGHILVVISVCVLITTDTDNHKN